MRITISEWCIIIPCPNSGLLILDNKKGYDAVGTRVDNTKLFIVKIYSVIYRLHSKYDI